MPTIGNNTLTIETRPKNISIKYFILATLSWNNIIILMIL
jgi:hypothetical protein